MKWWITQMDREIAGGDDFQLASYISSHSPRYIPAFAGDHILVSTLTINPHRGEKSAIALTLRGDCAPKEEAVYGDKTMAEQKFTVPSFPKHPTEEQRNKALAECKEKDPKGDLDRFLSSVTSNGYRLLLVRAREGRKDANGNPVMKKGPDGRDMKVFDTVTGFVWLPSIEGGTVDQFVAWFANRYFNEVSEATMQAAFTKFKKKAIDAELITLRSQLKAKKGTGPGRGGDIIF